MTLTTFTRPTYTRPAPPPVTLCAWVLNPFKMFPQDPNYLRAEILTVSPDTVTVREYDSATVFSVSRAHVHMVHTVNDAGETQQVYGEPRS